MENENVLELRDLKKYYPVKTALGWGRGGVVKAVDGVTLQVKAGETYGLVGESGSGKTTLGRSAILLERPTSGSVRFVGREITRMRARELRALRASMQIIFQDPFASLNPRMTVGSIVGEPILIHQKLSASERARRVGELLIRVGLEPGYASRYPHEFSGGQRQRIGIARAVSLNPKLIVCDEPVSSLDVSIQAQIIRLLQQLQQEHGIAYLFIAHNLAVVRHISDTIGVMYLGRLVEEAPAEAVFADPLHPYTRFLLDAVPRMEPKKKKERRPLSGEIPSPVNPPPGCPFHPRCPQAIEKCSRVAPECVEVRPGHRCACHLVTDGAKENG